MSVECKKEECCECKAAAAGAWVAKGFIAFSFALIFIGAVALAVFVPEFAALGIILAIVATIFFFAIFITASIVVLRCIKKDKCC
ncbi:hypothetical protein [Jeotgalibacillus marinus]|uniref:Uncharacterized protein n=1 Tax=Jeotgalibacillus marinus TaxID=86667 RepID=A0ABV3Q7K5_9BACL